MIFPVRCWPMVTWPIIRSYSEYEPGYSQQSVTSMSIFITFPPTWGIFHVAAQTINGPQPAYIVDQTCAHRMRLPTYPPSPVSWPPPRRRRPSPGSASRRPCRPDATRSHRRRRQCSRPQRWRSAARPCCIGRAASAPRTCVRNGVSRCVFVFRKGSKLAWTSRNRYVAFM